MADDASISDASTLQHQNPFVASRSPNPKALQLHPEDYISLLRTLQNVAFPGGEPPRSPSIRSDGSPTASSQPHHHNNNNNNAEGEKSESGTTDTEAFLDAVCRLLVKEPDQTVAAGLSVTKRSGAKGRLSAELYVSQTDGCPRSVRGQARKVWRCMQDVSHAASTESPRRTNSNRTASSGGSVWSAKTAADYYLLEAVTAYSAPNIMREIEKRWGALRLLKKVMRRKYKTSKRKGGKGDAFYDPSSAGVVRGGSEDEKLYDVVRMLCKGFKECRSLYKQLKRKEGEATPVMFTAIRTDADDVMDSLCRNLLASFSNFERGVGELDADPTFRMYDGSGVVDRSRTLSKLDGASAAFGFSITDYVMDVFTYWADFQVLDVYATYQRGRLVRMIDLDVCVLTNPTSSHSLKKKPAAAAGVMSARRALDIDAVQEILEDSNVSHPNVEKITEAVVTHDHKRPQRNKKKGAAAAERAVHDVPNVLANVPRSAYPFVGLSHSSNSLCVCCRLFLDSHNRAGAKSFKVREMEPDAEVSKSLPAGWTFPRFADLGVRGKVGAEFVSALRHKIQLYVFLILQRERNANLAAQKGKANTMPVGGGGVGGIGGRPKLTMSIPSQAQAPGVLRRSNTDASRRSDGSTRSSIKGRLTQWLPSNMRFSATY